MNQQQMEEDAAARPDRLERLLAYNAGKYPDKVALVDPLNALRLEGRAKEDSHKAYSYQQIDQIVSRLAARFGSLGLSNGDYVAVQLPNFSHAPLVILALMRANLVPCMIPLSWSMGQVDRSFERLKPRLLISCGQMEGNNHSEIMRELAFRHLHVRFVMGIGYNIADGITDISALFDLQNDADENMTAPARPGQDTALDEVALVTFIDEATPVPHTHGQILSCGLLQVLALELSNTDHILGAYPLSSLPGLASFFYPWLITGCTFTLHHPFDLAVLQEQIMDNEISFLAAPEQVIEWLATAQIPAPEKLAIVWNGDHLPGKALQIPASSTLFDLWNLSGLGLVPAKREGEQPVELFPHGHVCLPSPTSKELCLAAGKIKGETLHIKGRIFPPVAHIDTSLEWFSLKKQTCDGWIDTGLEAVAGPDHSIILTGQSTPLDMVGS